MRILHVTHLYRPALGGAEQHITDQSEELARRGHQVDVFTIRSTQYQTWEGDHQLLPVECLDQVNVHRFDAFKRGPVTWKLLNRGLNGYQHTRSARYAPLLIWGNGPISLSLMWTLWRHGRQYDLIHVNSLHYAPVFYTFHIARRLGVPFAITPFVHIDQAALFDIGFQNDVMRGADLVLAMTDKEKDYLVARGVTRERIAISGIGLHLEQYPQLDPYECRSRLNLPPDAFIVLFMARKERYKGLPTVMAAYERLQAQCPNSYLIAAGPETDDSRQLRQQYAHLPHIVYYEGVRGQLKLDLLNASDVFIMPSEGESFGIVYTEAWAVKKPVIGSTSGAIPSLITAGIDGFVIDPGDVDAAAAYLNELYQDSLLRERMGAAGYDKVTNRYTVPRVADTVEAAYMRTLRRHHPVVCES
jgi:glycosyltransferase involved in cell wall biosynthesis